MQTFMPYKSFESSARVLDRQRLGKQRVETMQIMTALVRGGGWENHPVTKMWRGHEYALMSYQEAICNEWTRRGYKDSCLEKTREIFMELTEEQRRPSIPAWLGLKKIHSIHRANLLRKSPTHYTQFHWPEKAQEGYWYPEDGFSR